MCVKKICLVFCLLTLIGCQSNYVSQVDGTELKVSHNPKAAETNVKLGLGYLHEGMVPRAKQKLLTALKEDPQSSVVNDAVAYFYETTHDMTEAEKYYQAALRLSRNNGAAYNNYGTFLCRQGQYANAEKYFIEAASNPAYVNASDAYENAGLCALKSGDQSKAEAYFKKTLQTDPDHTTSLVELANLANNKKKYREADIFLTQCMEKGDMSPRVLTLAADVSRKLGQFEKAKLFDDKLKSMQVAQG